MITPAPLILRGYRAHMLTWPVWLLALELSAISGACAAILAGLS